MLVPCCQQMEVSAHCWGGSEQGFARASHKAASVRRQLLKASYRTCQIRRQFIRTPVREVPESRPSLLPQRPNILRCPQWTIVRGSVVERWQGSLRRFRS